MGTSGSRGSEHPVLRRSVRYLGRSPLLFSYHFTRNHFTFSSSLLFCLPLLLLLAFAASLGAVEVQLTVADHAHVARRGATITSGIPFAKGVLKDAAKLSVSFRGQPIPAQFTPLALWDDGSVRWALMDCQVDLPAGGSAELVVRDHGGNMPPAAPVQVSDTADALLISNGQLELLVDKKKANLLTSLHLGSKKLLASAGRGLLLHTEDGKEVAAGPPSQVTIEQGGPMRAVVCLKGKFPGVHNGLLSYTVRLAAYAGQRFIKAHVWLENDGARGYGGKEESEPTNLEWLLFKGLAVELGLGLGPEPTASCEGVEAKGNLKVLQHCLPFRGPAKSRQSPPHVAWHTYDDMEYTITTEDVARRSAADSQVGGGSVPVGGGSVPRDAGHGGPAHSEKLLKKGERTDGVMTLKADTVTLTTAIHAFWQNYEKAIELETPHAEADERAEKKGPGSEIANRKSQIGNARLRLWLWPLGFQWPRLGTPTDYMSVYDRNLTSRVKKGLYNLPGGTHKGHEFILDFSGRPPQESAAELSAPLFALAPAAYYAATEAAPGLFAPPEVRTGDAECDAKLDAWMRMTRSAADPDSPTSLFAARRQVTKHNLFWLGWMDFGDIAVPGRGPCSLHYDWPWVMLLNALRTGDVRFLRLASDMVRHRVDVDQHWSDRERPEHRGLMLRDDNFPDHHCYRIYRPPDVTTNWLAGVVFYHMLTGDPKALECARRNAEALKPAWALVAEKKPWAGPQGNMAAIAWTIDSYGAMYDLTADKSWLDEALKLLRTHVAALRKSHGPHLFNPDAQVRSQDYVEEDVKYCYAIQFLCELHHRTGDEGLLKLLQEGCERKFPSTFFDAPIFLSGLHAYVGHVTGNKASLARAAELFAEGFPESKSPPVYLPDNSVWSRQAVMMLRAGHLLQWAHWKGRGAK
ncbi:MAG: hypothetical protein FJ291_18950 [Planctomycetes bacterium]|nr:hypothetical protein [Planctomycetota bacterium]